MPPKSSGSARSRRWCFTAFTEPKFDTSDSLFRYAVFQQEKCPNTERIHWQGYLEVTRPSRMTQIKSMFSAADGSNTPVNPHLATAYGTQESCIAYCTKDDVDGGRVAGTEVTTYGQPAGEGQRQDKETLEEVLEAIKNGRPLHDIEEAFPRIVCLHRQKIEWTMAARRERIIPSVRDITVEIHWGAPGTGKTYGVYSEFGNGKVDESGNPLLFKKTGHSGDWWDGYVGQPVLLLDDFYGQMKLEQLLHILDIYELRLPIKHGWTYAAWTKVIITSNTHPDSWWVRDGISHIPDAVRSAFMDRISRIVEYHRSQSSTSPCPGHRC